MGLLGALLVDYVMLWKSDTPVILKKKKKNNFNFQIICWSFHHVDQNINYPSSEILVNYLREDISYDCFYCNDA